VGTGMDQQGVHDLSLLGRKFYSLWWKGCCWGGRSAPCAVEGWLCDCGGGVESVSSYWLHEKRCVVLVGRLICYFVRILIINFCALINTYSKMLNFSKYFEPQVLIFRRIQLYTCSVWYCHTL